MQRPGSRRYRAALEAAAVQREAGPALDQGRAVEPRLSSQRPSDLSFPSAPRRSSSIAWPGTPPRAARGGRSRRCRARTPKRISPRVAKEGDAPAPMRGRRGCPDDDGAQRATPEASAQAPSSGRPSCSPRPDSPAATPQRMSPERSIPGGPRRRPTLMRPPADARLTTRPQRCHVARDGLEPSLRISDGGGERYEHGSVVVSKLTGRCLGRHRHRQKRVDRSRGPAHGPARSDRGALRPHLREQDVGHVMSGSCRDRP